MGTTKRNCYAVAKYKFFDPEIEALIVCYLDDKNKVISLTKIQNGEKNAEKLVGKDIKLTEIKN